jgi:hypothetical protein
MTKQPMPPEFARNYGMDHPDQAWLLHDWDVWAANPFYTGPKVPHPESEPEGEEAPGFDSPKAPECAPVGDPMNDVSDMDNPDFVPLEGDGL